MSISSLITEGLGAFGNIADMIRRGLNASTYVPPPAINEYFSAIMQSSDISTSGGQLMSTLIGNCGTMFAFENDSSTITASAIDSNSVISGGSINCVGVFI